MRILKSMLSNSKTHTNGATITYVETVFEHANGSIVLDKNLFVSVPCIVDKTLKAHTFCFYVGSQNKNICNCFRLKVCETAYL